MIASLFEDEEELAEYYTRRTYRGAVVKVNRLNEGEFVCLLGDAAHSVLPPTGEGIKAALKIAWYFGNAYKITLKIVSMNSTHEDSLIHKHFLSTLTI